MTGRKTLARAVSLIAIASLLAAQAPAVDFSAPQPEGAPSVPSVPALSVPLVPTLDETGLPAVAGLPADPATPAELSDAAQADQWAQGVSAGAAPEVAEAALAAEAAQTAAAPAALAASAAEPAAAPEGQTEAPGLLTRLAQAAASLLPKAGPRLIDRLRADIPQDAGPNASAEDDKAAAEEAFTFKAGGSSRKHGGKAGPGAPRDGSGNGGSNGFTPGPNADDGGGDGYPVDQVGFRGKNYPAAVFRPNVAVEPLIIQAIESAQQEIYVALYEFKLTGVVDALRAARERGVKVHIILDYSQVFPQQAAGDDYKPKRSKEIWTLLREGFDVKVLRGLGQFGINHNKFLVVDPAASQSLGEFGSYNWAWTAENTHYENANFTADKARIQAMLATWKWLDSLAQPADKAENYQWPSGVPPPPSDAIPTLDFNGTQLPIAVFSPDSRPGQSIEDRLVQAIGAAQDSIDVSIFALRSTLVASALLAAKKRGVAVRVIMDRGQSESAPFGPYAQWLAFNGIEVRTLSGPDPDSQYPLAQKFHHKFAIFDGRLVETGSANYTKYAAQANFENAQFLQGGQVARSYGWIYDKLWARAQPFPAPAAAPTLPTDAELAAEINQPVPPAAPKTAFPGPAAGVQAAPVNFNGQVFPSYAFRPDTPIAPLLVQAVRSAKKSIRLALYEFNLEEVLDALRDAKKAGLTVEIVIDRSHVYTTGRDHTGQPRKPSPQIQALINEGFDVLVLKGNKSGIQHNKYVIVDAEDGGLVEFGSYNWAETAENDHFENVIFSADSRDVADYLAYFKYQRALAKPVDHEKLEEVLTTGLAVDEDEAAPEPSGIEPLAAGAGAVDLAPGRKPSPGLPTPPASTAPPLTFNGETFARHYFSPHGGIEEAWIRAIGAAKESIDIAMFAFWSANVAQALVDAMQKNPALKVRLVLDAGQSKLAKVDGEPTAQWLAERGADVKTLSGPDEDGDPMFEKQHSKFMIVDGRLLLTGSFNLSPTAQNNSFENENVEDDPVHLRGFVDFFQRLYQEAINRAPKKNDVPVHATPNGA